MGQSNFFLTGQLPVVLDVLFFLLQKSTALILQSQSRWMITDSPHGFSVQ
jgi:hypothetical protein